MVERVITSEEPQLPWVVRDDVTVYYGAAEWLWHSDGHLSKERWVVEAVNTMAETEAQWAWQSQDVIGRIEKLDLSPTEKRRLVEMDEMEMLVGHMAEVVHWQIYPYQQEFHEGNLGSTRVIQGDDGLPTRVFRRISDMLRARVIKYPGDQRGRITKEVFETVVQPVTSEMNEGECLVFFSPPDCEGIENKYGFMYVYEKARDDAGREIVDCRSIMLDLIEDDYYQVIGRWEEFRVDGREVDKPIAAMVLKFPQGYFGSKPALIKEVLGEVWQERPLDVEEWYESHLHLYGQVRQLIRHHPLTTDYFQALFAGDMGRVERDLQRIRRDLLRRYQPQVWEEIQEEISRFGYVVINLGCGPLMFGGGADGWNMSLIGISGYEGKWEPGTCRVCKSQNVEVGECKVCRKCQREFDMGIRH